MENQPASPKIDFAIDEDLNTALVITCGNCGAVTKIPSDELTAEGNILCSGCHYEFQITADDITMIKKYLEDAKKLY